MLLGYSECAISCYFLIYWRKKILVVPKPFSVFMLEQDIFPRRVIGFMFFLKLSYSTVHNDFLSPFSCSAASSGLPRICFKCSNQAHSGGLCLLEQNCFCFSRGKFASLYLLCIRHFENFNFRTDTELVWYLEDWWIFCVSPPSCLVV